MAFFSGKVKSFRFRPKTMVHGFIFEGPTKVVRKVYQSKGNEKRNLTALVSGA